MPSTHTSLTGLGHWKGDGRVLQQLLHQSFPPAGETGTTIAVPFMPRSRLSGGTSAYPTTTQPCCHGPIPTPAALNAEPAHVPHPGHGAYGFTHFSAYLAFLSLPEALTSPRPSLTQDYPPSTALLSLSLPISLLV